MGRLSWILGVREMPGLEHYYKVIKPIGEGKFSTVFLAKHRETRKKYAVKHVDKHDEEFSKALLESEVAIMKAIHHLNVVRLCDVFDSDDSFCMVLEYVKGGELFDMIVDHGAYGEADALETFPEQLARWNARRKLKAAVRV